jgi:nicotinamidase-related amidase
MTSGDLTNETVNSSALVLIDLQRDFLRQDGRYPVIQSDVLALIRTVNEAINIFSAANRPIARIGNEYPADARFMNRVRRHAAIAGSVGAAWDDRVPALGEYFAKSRRDAFSNPRFGEWLRNTGVQNVILAGVFAEACVAATASAALKHGYHVTLLVEALTGRSARAGRRSLARLADRGATTAVIPAAS